MLPDVEVPIPEPVYLMLIDWLNERRPLAHRCLAWNDWVLNGPAGQSAELL